MGSAEYPEDADIHAEEQWETEGGRYGHREYRHADGTGWHEYWGTRIESWETRVFGTLDEARRYVNSRADPD